MPKTREVALEDLTDARKLLAVSDGRPWAELMRGLSSSGEVTLGDVADALGYSPHGLVVALGSALRRSGEGYSTLPLSWSTGPAAQQRVTVSGEVQRALRAERTDSEDVFGHDLDEDGGI